MRRLVVGVIPIRHLITQRREPQKRAGIVDGIGLDWKFIRQSSARLARSCA
jgi:hypothetical protein